MSQQNRTFSMQPLLHEGPPISSAWPLLHGASGAQAPKQPPWTEFGHSLAFSGK
jgi:hypothetical protein